MVAAANPKDSMLATWRMDKSLWGPDHYLINLFQPSNDELKKQVPVFKKSDPIPILTLSSCDLFVIIFALWPLAVQWLCIWVTGQNTSPLVTFLLYTFAFQANAIHEIKGIERLGLV